MTDTEDKNKINPVVAGVIGAAAGAAAALLSRKENREKVRKAAEDMKVKGGQAVRKLKKTMQRDKDDVKDEMERKIEDIKTSRNDDDL